MAQETFPKSWEGNYKGELQIYGVDSVRMKLTMKLDIVKKGDSIYQWKIAYEFNGKEDDIPLNSYVFSKWKTKSYFKKDSINV